MATHEYPVTVQWKGGRDGEGFAAPQRSGSKFTLGVPEEFGGNGGGTNPEELLTSAVASCYTLTFGIIAANRKLPVESLNVEAVGEVEQNGTSFVYTKVTLRPKIVLAAGASDADVTSATEMAMKADHYCLITNAVRDKVQVHVEPDVKIG